MKKFIVKHKAIIFISIVIIIGVSAFLYFHGVPVDSAEKFTWDNLLNG